jgi:hypothetical protein
MTFVRDIKLQLSFIFAVPVFAKLTALLIFILPWQTQFIFESFSISENAATITAGIFFSEIYLLILFTFFAIFNFNKISEVLRKFKTPFIFLLLAITFSTFLNSFSLFTPLHAFHIICGVLLFILISAQADFHNVFFKAFIYSLIIPIFIGFFQFIANFSPTSTTLGLAIRDGESLGEAVLHLFRERQLRAYGSFQHPNIFAGYLVVALFIITSHFKKHLNILITFFSFAVLTTFSKSAILAFALASMVFYLPTFYKIKPRSLKKNILAPFVILILLLSIFVRLQFNQFELNSFGDRVLQWSVYPSLIAEKNLTQFVFGHGLSTFARTWYVFDQTVSPWLYQPIHNIPALLFFELGLLGIFAAVFFLKKIFFTFSKYESTNFFIPSLFTLLITLSLFDHYLFSYWSGLALSSIILSFAYISQLNSVSNPSS